MILLLIEITEAMDVAHQGDGRETTVVAEDLKVQGRCKYTKRSINAFHKQATPFATYCI
jgi:hypothetical protein